MLVSRRPSQSPAAREVEQRKADALRRAQEQYGPDARIHALYDGEFFAEIPTSDPRRARVLPVTGTEMM